MPYSSTSPRRRRQALSTSEPRLERPQSAYTLDFDNRLPFRTTDDDRRLLPRLPLHVSLPGNETRLVRLWPLLDTGAEWTVFDGAVALQLGWNEPEIAGRAEDVRPLSRLGRTAGPLTGYLHRLTCYVPLGPRFATLPLRVLLTPPYALATPVLGRRDFFQQVDFALVEAERRVYLRFRDQAALREAWPDAP